MLRGLGCRAPAQHALVLQTDFGPKDGAVGAMRGVAAGVSLRIPIHDLSHDNTPFNLWEAAYRLKQAAGYWPEGTVFVSVIDPGVGGAKSGRVENEIGPLLRRPDNGTLRLSRRKSASEGCERSMKPYTGEQDRSVRTRFTVATFLLRWRAIAAEVVAFEEWVRRSSPGCDAAYERPRFDGTAVIGAIPFLDFQFGNVWTNIDAPVFEKLEPKLGDRFQVKISYAGKTVFTGELPTCEPSVQVRGGAPLLYLNSLLSVSFALNMHDFAKKHPYLQWSRLECPGGKGFTMTRLWLGALAGMWR